MYTGSIHASKLLFVFLLLISLLLGEGVWVSVTKLEEQRVHSFSSPYHKGTPEPRDLLAGPYPALPNEVDDLLSKATTLLPGSVCRLLALKKAPVS